MNTIMSARKVRILGILVVLLGLSQIVSGAPAGYRLPFTGFTYITQAPGCGTHIGDGPGEAIDFRLYYQPVYAAKAGEVRLAREHVCWGKYVQIVHGDGYKSFYGHLEKSLVAEGVHVNQGDVIGISGSTGQPGECISGPHLHFQVNNQETNRGIPIRDLAWIFWYSTNPDNLCVTGYDGEAVAPPVSAKPADSPGYYVRTLVSGLRVRLEPGTSSPATGTLPLSSIGLLIPNEQNGVYVDGYYWWNVHFKTDRCLKGWSAARTAGGEEWIEIINTHPSVGQGSSFPHLFVDAYTRVYGQESCGYQLFGYATNSVHSWSNGLIQDFRQGNDELAIMKPNSKNEAYGIYGAIWAKYKALAAFSYLGYPVSDERGTRSGAQGFSTAGRLQDFESGHLYYHKDGQRAGQTLEVHGAIDAVHQKEGGNNGWLGFPISDEFTNASGYSQSNFEGGYITTLDGITYRAFAWGVPTATSVPSRTPTATFTATSPPNPTSTSTTTRTPTTAATTPAVTATSTPSSTSLTTPTTSATLVATGTPTMTLAVSATSIPTSAPTATSTAPPICYDFNGDGIVDMADIQIVIAAWRVSSPAYDLNEDNEVTIRDIMLVAAHWGEACPGRPTATVSPSATATCCAPPPTPPPVLEPSATCVCPGPPTEVP